MSIFDAASTAKQPAMWRCKKAEQQVLLLSRVLKLHQNYALSEWSS
jgi:hypothetical protein